MRQRPHALLTALLALLAAPLLGACSRASAAAPSYGTVMSDVGRRFELLGAAVASGRLELADYELGELAEAFEDALPHAGRPKEGRPEALPAQERTFVATALPELERAVKGKDRAAIAAAFAKVADACNGCHQASGHGFIEVPREPGRRVPKLDPLAP